MKPIEDEQSRMDYAAAVARAQLWSKRALAARASGRDLHASRCEDTARDWWSKARQIEKRQQATEKQV